MKYDFRKMNAETQISIQGFGQENISYCNSF